MMMMMMMMSCLSGPFLLLLSSPVSGLGSVVWKHYSYVQKQLNWADAQSYCRRSNKYDDLAVLYKPSDAALNLKPYKAWVSFFKPLSDRQSFTSNSGLFYSYPLSNGICAVVFYPNHRIDITECERYFFFICQKRHAIGLNYTFVPQSKTWSEARRYCRDQYDDLAVYHHLQAAGKSQEFPVWIGLHKDDTDSHSHSGAWKWSSGSSEYRNWASQEPTDKGSCVAISSLSKEMATQDCSARFPFICYRDNLVLVKENKTWEEALERCRSLEDGRSYDLVSVQPGQDNDHVMHKLKEAVTDRAWVGLRFLAGFWLWVNGADLLYDLPPCPLNAYRCGAMNETGGVEITDCTERSYFLCYRKS